MSGCRIVDIRWSNRSVLIRAGGYHTAGMSYPDPRQPQWQPQPVFVAMPPPRSGLATTSLVFGLIGLPTSFCLFGLPSLVAVICGHLALREIKRDGKRGNNAAVWGLVLGYLLVVPGVLGTGMWLLGG